MRPLAALAFSLSLPPMVPLRGPTTEGLAFSADGKAVVTFGGEAGVCVTPVE